MSLFIIWKDSVATPLKNSSKWTKSQEEFLIENYQKMTVSEISNVINKHPKVIYTHISQLRQSKDPEIVEKLRKINLKAWSESDDDFLRNNYKRLKNREIAEKLGRTLAAVNTRARQLKVAAPRWRNQA